MGNAAAPSDAQDGLKPGASRASGGSSPGHVGRCGSSLFDPSCCQCDSKGEDRSRSGAELSLPNSVAPGSGGAASLARGVSEVDKSRYYREWDTIKGALVGGDTVLIRGTFLEHLHSSSSFLPRWQDLPPSAAWDAEELLREVQDANRPTPKIIAISYSWLSTKHPDPEAFHLGAIVPMLRPYAKHLGIGVESLALFIDWCSMPQRPWSEDDTRAHQRAMRNIDIWYAHLLTDVWCLSTLPQEGLSNTNLVPYEERGWPGLERAAGTMICASPGSILDLGLLKLNAQEELEDWLTVMKICKVPRRPPLLPEEFAQDLESKSFAYPEDRRVVSNKYWGIFHRAMGAVETLSYSGLQWGDSEATALAKVLPSCAGLRELDIRSNKIESMGVLALVDAMPEGLCRWDVSDNAIGESTQQDLRARWAAAQRAEAGLIMREQRRTSLTPELERAASEKFKAPGSPHKAAGAKLSDRSKLNPDNNRALNTLLARQAAFEARIESAMAKVAENVAELSREANVPTGTASAKAREARVAALTALGVEAGELQQDLPQAQQSQKPAQKSIFRKRSLPTITDSP